VRVEWIADPDRLEALGLQWDRLAEADPSPFSGHAWFMCWWRAYRPERPMAACLIWNDDSLAAAAMLEPGRGRLLAAANEQTPAFRPLAGDEEARRHLAQALAGAGKTVELRALPTGEPAMAALVEELETAGARTLIEDDFVSPIAEIAGSFEDYRDSLKGGWKELERRGRKLHREHQVEEALVQAPDQLEEELEAGLALEGAGWKGETSTAILSTSATAAFYRELAREFHERGELAFSSLRADGRLVAFDFAFLHRGRYFLLKTAYDEGARSLAPGLVLRRAVIERCFELGLEAHEFLGADMPWKRLFSTAERRHSVVRSYPPRLGARLDYTYRQALRPALKRAYLGLRH
jgi:CelD/BcsL family acetyltransferase involved in cellulose biosynthesis